MIFLIVFIRSNPVISDSRVEKEVASLSSNGFKVVVLAWNRKGKFRSDESGVNHRILRFNLSAPYRKFTILFYYPLFWFWILVNLFKINPEIVHACDLDTVYPSLLYRFFRRKVKVVFDVFDTFTLLIEAKSPLLGSIVRGFELFAASASDVLLTVSDERLVFFRNLKLKRTEILMNCPPFRLYDLKDKETKNSDLLRIVYAGAIAPYRGLLEVAKALQSIDKVEFIVAGNIIDNQIADKLKKFSFVKYVGQLPFEDSLKLQMNADVIPVLYDLNLPINKVAQPNKLYEAMSLGIPVITNLNKFLDDVPFGVYVDYYNRDQIRDALILLQKNPILRTNFGVKGRLAFKEKYNWSIMEKKIIRLYYDLTNKKTVEKRPLKN